jgi:hypothetical protein
MTKPSLYSLLSYSLNKHSRLLLLWGKMVGDKTCFKNAGLILGFSVVLVLLAAEILNRAAAPKPQPDCAQAPQASSDHCTGPFNHPEECRRVTVREAAEYAGMLAAMAQSPLLHCTEMVGAGDWNVCMDRRFPHPDPQAEPCLVYSIGIADDTRFDDEWGLRGCEVHAFDPTLKEAPAFRSPNVHFHFLGLTGDAKSTADQFTGNSMYGSVAHPLKPLDQIIVDLGHRGRTIDVL